MSGLNDRRFLDNVGLSKFWEKCCSVFPSVTGQGATGTWGISISGKANTAGDADTLDGHDSTYFAPASSIGNGTVTIMQNSDNKGSFTLNQSGSATITLTDTDTKVTSASNHYVPSKDGNSTLSEDASGGTKAWGQQVVTGVNIERDARGHVTGLTLDSAAIPNAPFIPTSLKNPYSLTIQKNGTTIDTYDGSTPKIINITVPTIPTTLPANGGNADTVDGKHASDFVLKNGDTMAGNLTMQQNGGGLILDQVNGNGTTSIYVKPNGSTASSIVKMQDASTLRFGSSNFGTLITGKSTTIDNPTTISKPLTIECSNDNKLIFNNTDDEKFTQINFDHKGVNYAQFRAAKTGVFMWHDSGANLYMNGNTVLHASNYTSYAVPSYGAVGTNYSKNNGIGYTYDSTEHGGKLTGGFITASNGSYGFQLNGHYNGTGIAYRGINAGSFTNWKMIPTVSYSGIAVNTPLCIENNELKSLSGIFDSFIKWKSIESITSRASLGSLFSPIDAAVSAIHSANRLAFGKPDGLSVEYSTDGGNNWKDYGLTNNEKINLVSGIGQNVLLGKGESSKFSPNDMLRITINATNMGFYTFARALHLNISHEGAWYNTSQEQRGIRLDVQKSMKGSETTFVDWITDTVLSGWSGWNKLPLTGVSFGGGSSQTGNIAAIRLIFSAPGGNTYYTTGGHPIIKDLQLIGTEPWSNPSNMAKNGHLYSYDAEQNAIFPANVTATNDIYGKVIHVKGSANNTTGYISSDANYNMFISQNNIIPFVIDCSNTNAPSIRAGYSHANTVSLGTSTVPFKNVYAGGFTKKDSSDSYVLLGGGGHKLLSEITSTGSVSWKDITDRPTSLPANGGNADTVGNKRASDFAAAGHAHTVRLSGSITPNITASYSNGVLTLSGAATTISMVGTSEAEGASPNPESWFVSPDDLAALF